MALFRRGNKDPAKRKPRKDRRGASPLAVGAILLAVLIIATYLGFTKHIPFTHGFRVNAVFANANSIRKGSPVRIAGVNIGKVTDIERYKNTRAAVITMQLQDSGVPIHTDATMKVRPRIFLEGNFFVDIQPGTPNAPILSENGTIPIAQTSSPVQFGDVLTTLQANDRQNLQTVVRTYGDTLTRKPSARDNAAADPSTRGQSAAQALNGAARNAGPAFRQASIVGQAFLGEQPHDLSGLIHGLSRITVALSRDEGTLQDFVTNFNTTVAAFAAEKTNLQATIRGLAPTLVVANKTLGDLDAAFPPVRQFAIDILPGVRETPATIDAAFPWIKQTRGLLQKTELRGLAEQLSPATRDLSKTVDATVQFLPQQDLIAKCLTNVVLPTGNIKIADGPLSTNAENYKEFWYTMVGLAGESQNFDGNGQYVRFQPGGSGGSSFSVGQSSLSGATFFGRDPASPIGTRPAYTQQRPPYRPDVPCYTQQLPDLNGAATGPPDGSQTSGGSGGTPVPGTGITLPPLPSVPTLPTVSARRTSAKTSVAGALLNTLNPFRSRRHRAKAAPKARKASRP